MIDENPIVKRDDPLSYQKQDTLSAPTGDSGAEEKDTKQQINHVPLSLSRKELEDGYLSLNHENFFLRKSLKDKQREVKKLTSSVPLRDSPPKSDVQHSSFPHPHYDTAERLHDLEASNKALLNKVNVLRHQLEIHTRLHAEVHNRGPHSASPRRHDCSNVDTSRRMDSGARHSSPPSLMDGVKNTPPKNRGTSNERRLPQVKEVQMSNDGNVDNEKELDVNGVRTVVFDDEAKDQRRSVAENVDLIRLKRTNKLQQAQITALKVHVEACEKEVNMMRLVSQKYLQENEDLSKHLAKERQRNREMQADFTESSSVKESLKALQEEIRDLQNERNTLRDTNEKLLALIAQKSDDTPRESQYKKQVLELEGRVNRELGERASLLERIRLEQVANGSLRAEAIVLRQRMASLEQSS